MKYCLGWKGRGRKDRICYRNRKAVTLPLIVASRKAGFKVVDDQSTGSDEFMWVVLLSFGEEPVGQRMPAKPGPGLISFNHIKMQILLVSVNCPHRGVKMPWLMARALFRNVWTKTLDERENAGP